MVLTFKNPRTLFWHIGQDLLVNGINIEHKIQDAIVQYDAQNYEAFGEDIGDALALILLGTDQQQPAEAQDDKVITEDYKAITKEIEDIVMGILYGAVQAEGLENINGCIEDTEKFFKDVLSAVQDFETETASGMSAGIKKLGDAIMDVKDGIIQCEGVEADVEALEKMVKVFSSPTTFLWHVGEDLLVNGVSIFKEIDDSVKQFENANYFEFGEDVGEALAQLIFGAPIEMLEKAEDKRIPALAVEPEQMYIF
jgi:hypothetical protein